MSNDNEEQSPAERLRNVTEHDIEEALRDSCIADLLHRVDPAELVEFLNCVADRLYGPKGR